MIILIIDLLSLGWHYIWILLKLALNRLTSWSHIGTIVAHEWLLLLVLHLHLLLLVLVLELGFGILHLRHHLLLWLPIVNLLSRGTYHTIDLRVLVLVMNLGDSGIMVLITTVFFVADHCIFQVLRLDKSDVKNEAYREEDIEVPFFIDPDISQIMLVCAQCHHPNDIGSDHLSPDVTSSHTSLGLFLVKQFAVDPNFTRVNYGDGEDKSHAMEGAQHGSHELKRMSGCNPDSKTQSR